MVTLQTPCRKNSIKVIYSWCSYGTRDRVARFPESFARRQLQQPYLPAFLVLLLLCRTLLLSLLLCDNPRLHDDLRQAGDLLEHMQPEGV